MVKIPLDILRNILSIQLSVIWILPDVQVVSYNLRCGRNLFLCCILAMEKKFRSCFLCILKTGRSALLENSYFNHPVCIDEDDAFNRLNHFPSDMSFQTFLLDKDNKVVVIGNPIHNLKLGELYMQIIQGEEKKQKNVDRRSITTEVSIARSTVFLGNFDWQTKQKAIFTLKNTGGNPLVIENVSTSCGCTSAFYSQKPILSGKETKIEVIYEAEQPEYFNKKITVYCNAESSPIILSISGDAK